MGEAREGHRGGIKYHFWGFSDSISLLLDSAVACWQMFPLTTTHSPHENKYTGMLAATRCVETQHYRRQIRDLVLSSTIPHARNEFNDNAIKEKQYLANGPVIQTETQAPSTQSDIDISASGGLILTYSKMVPPCCFGTSLALGDPTACSDLRLTEGISSRVPKNPLKIELRLRYQS